MSLRQPPLDRSEERLEAGSLGAEPESAQQRATEGERTADLDHLVPQEVDRWPGRSRARSPISTAVPRANAAVVTMEQVHGWAAAPDRRDAAIPGAAGHPAVTINQGDTHASIGVASDAATSPASAAVDAPRRSTRCTSAVA